MLFAGTKQHNKQEDGLLWWEENIDVSWIILAEAGLLGAPVGFDVHCFVIENVCIDLRRGDKCFP